VLLTAENFKAVASICTRPVCRRSPLGRRIWRALKCNYESCDDGGKLERETEVGGRQPWDAWKTDGQAHTTIWPTSIDNLLRPASSPGPRRRTHGELAAWKRRTLKRPVGPSSARLWSGRPEAIKALWSRGAAVVVAVFLRRHARLLRCHTW